MRLAGLSEVAKPWRTGTTRHMLLDYVAVQLGGAASLIRWLTRTKRSMILLDCMDACRSAARVTAFALMRFGNSYTPKSAQSRRLPRNHAQS